MEQRSLRRRWLVVGVVALIWMAAVLARLSYLQLFCYGEYFARAQHQQRHVFEISPKRGTIYDRKGRELAISMPMDSVFADPVDVKDAPLVARLLSRVLNVPPEEIETKIRDARTPVRLAKKLSPEIVQRIDDMNLKGIFFQKENRRVYPQRKSLAHTLGYVDTDEKGIGGIEYAFDKQIRGKPGRMMVMSDGKRRWYDRSEAAADPGASVVLTVDETIQFIAEKELERGMEDTHSKHGTVVIQDPNTGELLALANFPTFDPNDAGSYSDDVRMNRAVTAAYEPGSTFKVITMTGAIENGVTDPDKFVDCQMGSILLAGRLIHDWHPFGVLSVRDVLANSSDVGSIKVALELGAPRFYDTIRSFGIGQLTGIELPGENRGKLRPVENWNPSAIGSVAIGQEVSVTPVQIISAISAVANGGMLYKPRVVKEIEGGTASGPLSRPAPQQATDAKTAATVRGMMETVVLSGTGKLAHLNGYTAAGKSGTAQEIDPDTGRYSPNKYMASFVGFAPVNEPAVTILVVFDSPEGAHHGGEIGGPVFKRIAEQVLAYLDVQPDVPVPSDLETAKNTQRARAPEEDLSDEINETRFKAAAGQPDASSGATVVLDDENAVTVPDLAGETVRSVTEDCSRLGLVPSLIGSGLALEQAPEAGTRVLHGSRVTVRFGRVAAEVASKVAQRNVN
ncbi:MAG TPA: penicillin-binding transpeptidase domain-containing protein [Candidatus Sulfotelmatobacter sp.]|nr:penicillin-binding transpeptidase domain-containing protein [Candidatus Sulfotelmatobacter sp.]